MAKKSLGGVALPRKKWGVLAYIVAEPPPGFSGAQDLNPNAHAEVQAIAQAGDALQPFMHVAYQVDYGDKVGIFRQIVDGPTPDVVRVDEPPDAEAGDPTVLTNFFQWAIKECPAERYAVFFWGHSFGPASMFAPPLPGLRVLGLPELRGALSSFRKNGQELDVVLFKDCWMSTLETACELQDVARFVVASQALVPIASVWPYEDLFTDLAVGKSASECALVTTLGKFYDKPENRVPDDAVPFALLDLRKVDRVSDALNGLVDSLREVGTEDRRRAIEHASIADIALADVRTLCANLQRACSPRTAAAAAQSLDAAVNDLVVHQYAQIPGFRGVSVFYYPSQERRNSPDGGRIIWPLLPFSRYATFRLGKETEWKQVAFEQLRPVKSPTQPVQSLTRMEHAMPNRRLPGNFGPKIDDFGPKIDDFGPVISAHNAFIDALRIALGDSALTQLTTLSTGDTSGALVGVITELMTNIQALDKSVTRLSQLIEAKSLI